MNDPIDKPTPFYRPTASYRPTGHRPLRVGVGTRWARTGFTLMELVVASALMATLMVGLWGLVNIFTSLADKGTDQLQRIRNATQLFQWLEKDLRSVPGTTARYATPLLVGNESTLELQLVAAPALQWLGRAEPQSNSQQSPARETSGAGSRADVAAEPSAVHRVHYRYPTRRQSMAETPVGEDAVAIDENLAGLWRYDMRSAGGDMRSAGGDMRSAGGDNRSATSDMHSAGEDLSSASGDMRFASEDARSADGSERTAEGDGQWFGTALQFEAVEAVRFSYFDGRRWATQWNSAGRGGLPVAVRVEAWFQGGSALSSQLVDSDLATADLQPAIDAPPTADTTADNTAGGPSATDQSTSTWAEALSPLETRTLPQRRADLTRWVALR